MIKVLLLLTPLLLSAHWKEAIVKRVVDGDTIIIKTSTGSTRARLIGFDTPESFLNSKIYKQAEQCSVTVEKMLMAGKIAKRYTSTRLKKGSKIAYLDFGRDYFHRRLIWIRGFNYRIVADGFSRFYPKADLPTSITRRLLKAEKAARSEKKGIWSLFSKSQRENFRCY